MLNDALNCPGKLLEVYSYFHNYSLSNQLLANLQLPKAEPINTFKGWQKLGRNVKKGEKAIELMMPKVVSKEDEKTGEKETFIAGFFTKRAWFGLSQTEGEDYAEAAQIPNWDKDKALAELGIEISAFEHTNGNVQGYAKGSRVAVSPIAALPHKTLFHELAHVVLGHTKEALMSDDEKTEKNIKEVEAESVAYILCSLLNLPGVEYCRGYIQNWLNGGVLPEKSSAKIFGAANKILNAGKAA